VAVQQWLSGEQVHRCDKALKFTTDHITFHTRSYQDHTKGAIMATRTPQINLNRSIAKGSVRNFDKTNPSNPMTKGQARLLFFAVKELTGERLDLFSTKTPKLVHGDITELCGILKKDSGATQDDQQLAIDILVGDLRVPVQESTPRPASSAGRAAAKNTPAPAPEAGKVGITVDKPKKMTPAQSLAKARAAKKAKATRSNAEQSNRLQQIQAANANGIVPVVKDGQIEAVASPAPSSTADQKLALLVSGLADLIKAVA
jgi:hypothetical protein